MKTGNQTIVTPKIKKIASSISGEGVELIKNISNYIKSMNFIEGSLEPDFSRTADEILRDGRYNGCNEAGIVFVALLGAKGIPAVYIQALKKSAVENYSTENPSLNGHVFIEANIGGKKIFTNSTTGEITDELPENMIEGARGLDAWDIGLEKGFADLQRMFERRQTAYST